MVSIGIIRSILAHPDQPQPQRLKLPLQRIIRHQQSSSKGIQQGGAIFDTNRVNSPDGTLPLGCSGLSPLQIPSWEPGIVKVYLCPAPIALVGLEPRLPPSNRGLRRRELQSSAKSLGRSIRQTSAEFTLSSKNASKRVASNDSPSTSSTRAVEMASESPVVLRIRVVRRSGREPGGRSMPPQGTTSTVTRV